MNINVFKNEVLKMGISISDIQLKQLNEYYNLLIEWNNKINLTGITNYEEVYLKHFYDSLTICRVIDLNKENSLVDIGTGAGFPGLVLKIIFPQLQVDLIDSLGKRIIFLQDVVNKLNLQKINVINARAEEYAINHREEYDIVTARAVAPLNILLEYCLPLVKNRKYFISLKANCEQEISSIESALEKLKGKIIFLDKFQLPIEGSNRTIIKIQKMDITPKKYPRRYSEIKKKAL